MRYLKNAAGLAVLVLVVSASTAVAQAKGKWELGADFVGFNSNSPDGGTSSTSINILGSAFLGGASIRAGKMVSDKVSIEPMVTIGSVSGGGSVSQTTIEIAALWHLKAVTAAAPGWFVRPAFALTSTSGGGSSLSRTRLGAGFGMKKQLKNILVVRGEAYFFMTPEKDAAAGETDFGIRGGLSIFP